MKPDRAGRLEELEKEDARPRRLPADAESDKAITKEAGSGRYRARRSGAGRSSMPARCSDRIAPRGAGGAVSRGSAAPHSGARRSPPGGRGRPAHGARGRTGDGHDLPDGAARAVSVRPRQAGSQMSVPAAQVRRGGRRGGGGQVAAGAGTPGCRRPWWVGLAVGRPRQFGLHPVSPAGGEHGGGKAAIAGMAQTTRRAAPARTTARGPARSGSGATGLPEVTNGQVSPSGPREGGRGTRSESRGSASWATAGTRGGLRPARTRWRRPLAIASLTCAPGRAGRLDPQETGTRDRQPLTPGLIAAGRAAVEGGGPEGAREAAFKEGRLQLADSLLRAAAASCTRTTSRSYDFMQARTSDVRAFRMLTVIDESTREGPAIDVARRLTSDDVPERLSGLACAAKCPRYPLGQQAGVHGEDGAGSAGLRRGAYDPVHRAGGPVGGRVHRELRRRARRRAAGWRGLRRAAGGEGPDRALAGRVQHRAAPEQPGVSAAGAGGDRAVDAGPRGFASLLGPPSMAETVGALT